MKSLSSQNKTKSATRGAQFVPIAIPTICLYNFLNIIQEIRFCITYILTRPKYLLSMVCRSEKRLLIVTGKIMVPSVLMSL